MAIDVRFCLRFAPLAAIVVCGCTPRAIDVEAIAETFELDAGDPSRELALEVCYSGPTLEWTSGAIPVLDLLPDGTASFEDLTLEVTVGSLEPESLPLNEQAQVRVPYDQSIFEEGGCAPIVIIDIAVMGDLGARSVLFAPIARMSMDYIIEDGSFTPIEAEDVVLRFVDP